MMKLTNYQIRNIPLTDSILHDRLEFIEHCLREAEKTIEELNSRVHELECPIPDNH